MSCCKKWILRDPDVLCSYRPDTILSGDVQAVHTRRVVRIAGSRATHTALNVATCSVSGRRISQANHMRSHWSAVRGCKLDATSGSNSSRILRTARTHRFPARKGIITNTQMLWSQALVSGDSNGARPGRRLHAWDAPSDMAPR